jgi:hypothetical protein
VEQALLGQLQKAAWVVSRLVARLRVDQNDKRVVFWRRVEDLRIKLLPPEPGNDEELIR